MPEINNDRRCKKCNKVFISMTVVSNRIWDELIEEDHGLESPYCLECLDKIAREKGLVLTWQPRIYLKLDREG